MDPIRVRVNAHDWMIWSPRYEEENLTRGHGDTPAPTDRIYRREANG